MSAREHKVKTENKSAAGNYFKKASDNYDQMLTAFHASNWNAAKQIRNISAGAGFVLLFRNRHF